MNESSLLIVDDEQINLKLIRNLLQRENYLLYEARGGEEALYIAKSKLPDVILLDVMMPDLDGFEVTRRLKADESTRDIPVILLTALDGSENRTKGLEAGADEFLSKPVHVDELRIRVRSMSRLANMHRELRTRTEVGRRLLKLPAENDFPDMDSILLAENDPALAKLLTGVLEQAGFYVFIAESEAELWEILTQILPGLIILGLDLPENSNLQLLRSLKRTPGLQDIPILEIAADCEPQQKLDCLAQGADDYLSKPVNSDELVARSKAALRRAETLQQIKREYERLCIDTITDALTGALNRRYLDADLAHRTGELSRYPGKSLGVAMLDIDHFKYVNDQYGHVVGDQVLKHIAKLVQRQLRASDYLARYGGEEFCLIMPNTQHDQLLQIAERVRCEMAHNSLQAISNHTVTVSLGVTTYRPGDTAESLLKRADAALYKAKLNGRNQVFGIRAQQL